MPGTDNPFARAARLEKAAKLVAVLHVGGIRAEVARLMDDSDWDLAAACAGVTRPSVETRLLVLEQLGRLHA